MNPFSANKLNVKWVPDIANGKKIRKIILTWLEVGKKRLWRKSKKWKSTVVLTNEIVKQAMYSQQYNVN